MTDDETKFQPINITYGSNAGKTTNFITPTVVSEDKVVRSTDANGYSYDVATNPEGTVHFNIPSFSWNAAGGNAHPDYNDFLEVIVTGAQYMTAGVNLSHNGNAVIASQQNVEWHGVDGSTYMIVTVEKTSEGQEMKFEYNNWKRFVREITPTACPGMARIIERQRAEGGIVCTVSHSESENILRDWRANFNSAPDAVYGWDAGEGKRKPDPFVNR